MTGFFILSGFALQISNEKADFTNVKKIIGYFATLFVRSYTESVSTKY